MRLSSMLHRYINKGRNGRSDASNTTDITLTDKQLCELWMMATELESALSNYHSKIRLLAKEDFSLLTRVQLPVGSLHR